MLGRNATWKKTLRINRLPKYLCVQFMRFYWKATPESRDHAGVKCKMLRVCSGRPWSWCCRRRMSSYRSCAAHQLPFDPRRV